MATSYKIRLKRFNGLDYDTLNLLSENIIRNNGNTVEQEFNNIIPSSNGMLKNNNGIFNIATLGSDYTAVDDTVSSSAVKTRSIDKLTELYGVNTASLTIPYASWTGSGPYAQTITITGATVTTKTKVDIQPDATAIAQLINDGVTALYIENNNGTLTVYAVGAATTANITVQISYYETV